VSALSATAAPAAPARATGSSRVRPWVPIAALTLLAAALRLSTLDLQSFWYDEAFTPVHVLHASLSATLRSVAHSENSPPLWYVLEWLFSRVLGSGEVALRLLSALAGIATVPVAWAIGRELSDRRAAILCAAIVAVNPLFVWYSQEARVYALFVLTASIAMLCFLRAQAEPAPRRMAAFALAGAAALCTHYFAVFLLAPMALWLLREPVRRRASLPALGALVLTGLALVPLVSEQGGHGTQWIGRWPLSERLQAIPQYYLTGYTGSSLGHGLELLLALAVALPAGFGLWRLSGLTTPAAARAGRGALLAFAIAAAGVLAPVVLALLGADYLAPRNLVAAMIPVTALIAVLVLAPAASRADRTLALAGALVIVIAFLAITIDVDLSPRLQRGDWRGVAHALGRDGAERAITSVELGAAPLEYYIPGLHNLHRGRSVQLSEIDETGYAPLRASAGSPPAPGFRLFARLNVHGLIVYRFRSPLARAVPEAALRRHVITRARPEVLVPGSAHPGA
jgi:mannosyltransferase